MLAASMAPLGRRVRDLATVLRGPTFENSTSTVQNNEDMGICDGEGVHGHNNNNNLNQKSTSTTGSNNNNTNSNLYNVNDYNGSGNNISNNQLYNNGQGGTSAEKADLNKLEPPPLALVLADGPESLQPDFLEHLWNLASLRVCVDGAANSLHEQYGSPQKLSAAHFTPNLIIGDQDSIDPRTRDLFEARGTRVMHVPDQDSHDLEKALRAIAELQEETMPGKRFIVIVLGATGGRVDHQFANFSMLFKFYDKFHDLFFLSDQTLSILLMPGEHIIERPEEIIGPTCGLAPLAGPACVSTTGLKWNLSNQVLALGGLVSSSNEMLGSIATVKTDNALLWSSVPLGLKEDDLVDANEEIVNHKSAPLSTTGSSASANNCFAPSESVTMSTPSTMMAGSVSPSSAVVTGVDCHQVQEENPSS
mmetsp:Transcript_11578/g.22780  ORF Transcript_11578/g.22780 Transcript_11578/m.22780 type:complete len:420 (-) Transcript_11578:709-1968(-)